MWARHISSIAGFFEHHALRSEAVVGCDMAGLATAIGSSNSFGFLPHALNYRPVCFRLRRDVAGHATLFHMAGMRLAFEEIRSVEGMVRLYWQQNVLPVRLEQEAPSADWHYAHEVLGKVLDVVRGYELDEVLR